VKKDSGFHILYVELSPGSFSFHWCSPFSTAIKTLNGKHR